MTPAEPRPSARWWTQVDISTAMAVVALVISGLSYYRSYIYTKQDLEITVTEVSYVTNQGELYISVAFSNGGNRDAAVLRIEPALWSAASGASPRWRSLNDRVHPNIPVTSPKTPLTVKAGGVEVVALSAMLEPARRGTNVDRLAGRRVPRHPRRDDEL